MLALGLSAPTSLLIAALLGPAEPAPEPEAAPSEDPPAAQSEGEAGVPATQTPATGDAAATGEVETPPESQPQPSADEDIFADDSPPAAPPTPTPAPTRQVTSDELPPRQRAGVLSGKARFLGPATRRGFIHLAAGGSRPIRNPEYDTLLVDSLMLEQSIGIHLGKGEGHSDALALVTQQTFTEPFNAYVVAFRYLHDIVLDDRLGAYLTPMLTFGYRRVTDRGTENFSINCPPDVPITCEPEAYNQMTLQLGLGVTVVIADRLPLFIRPINLDLGLPHIEDGEDPVITLRWQILGGLGFTF